MTAQANTVNHIKSSCSFASADSWLSVLSTLERNCRSSNEEPSETYQEGMMHYCRQLRNWKQGGGQMTMALLVELTITECLVSLADKN